MDLEALKAAIRASAPLIFCRQRLFDSSAWFFDNAATFGFDATYDDFRFQIGTLVNTSPNNIAIIGSAKFGFSLAPDKDFRAFGDGSDIDVIVVNPSLFDETWTHFRLALYSGYDWIQKRHANEIIRKYIVLSGSEQYDSAYLREVSLRLLAMRKAVRDTLRISNSINYRIYSSWDDAEMYHVYSVEKLKEKLEKANAQ